MSLEQSGQVGLERGALGILGMRGPGLRAAGLGEGARGCRGP